MKLGPLLLALMGVFIGLVPGFFDSTFGAGMASAILGQSVDMELTLWHGVNPAALLVLGLSAITLLAGTLAFRAVERRLHSHEGREEPTERELLSGRVFERGLEGLYAVAGRLTLFLHRGSLRIYLLVTVLTSVAVLAVVLLRDGLPPLGAAGPRPEWIELSAVILVAGGALYAVVTSSRLAAVAGIGATGAGMSLLFLFFGAPDLAITQIMAETLTVILFVLVFYRMEGFVRRSSIGTRIRDAFIATAAGATVSLAVLAASAPDPFPRVSAWHALESLPSALGRNVVNVILVDFRALDTLGESLVVVVAGLGVWALLRSRRDPTMPESKEEV